MPALSPETETELARTLFALFVNQDCGYVEGNPANENETVFIDGMFNLREIVRGLWKKFGEIGADQN